MDIRYSTNPKDAKHYTTEKLRKEFLIQNPYEVYTFIWAMGGENQAFGDMDAIPIAELR